MNKKTQETPMSLHSRPPGVTRMPPNPLRRRLLAGAWLAGLWPVVPLRAAGYPGQPVRLVVPFPPGGATDTLARLLAARLQEAWGQPVTVENKPGAGGSLGTDLVAKAPADGYTVLMGITALIQAPPLMPRLPYDPIKDLAPVTEVGRTSSVFCVPAASPAADVKQFVAMVRAQPGRYNFGSYGNGTSSHIHGALLAQQAGLDLAHVPYKGAAPLLTDLIGGQLSAAFVDSVTASPQLKSGRFRVLAVTGARRNPLLPEVPTFQELGYHSFEPYGWFGLFMPAAAPAAVVAQFSAEARRILQLQEVRAKFDEMGVMPVGNSPEEFARTVREDAKLYARIIKEARITLE
jgi:tripartite-type tricarboxylate transporter receptor subunit TctC